jgi:hypothetical protein
VVRLAGPRQVGKEKLQPVGVPNSVRVVHSLQAILWAETVSHIGLDENTLLNLKLPGANPNLPKPS